MGSDEAYPVGERLKMKTKPEEAMPTRATDVVSCQRAIREMVSIANKSDSAVAEKMLRLLRDKYGWRVSLKKKNVWLFSEPHKGPKQPELFPTPKSPTDKAIEAFGEYAGMGAPHVPIKTTMMSAVQVRLTRWQNKNFKINDMRDQILGAMEELGELSRAVLKNRHQIREFVDPNVFREKAGDAIADTAIFLTQLATYLRIDFATLYEETANEVMTRDWVADPEHGQTLVRMNYEDLP